MKKKWGVTPFLLLSAASALGAGGVDDATLLANVAEALRARVAPRAKSGMVDSAQVVRDAEEAALGVAGVAGVDNQLIPAELFEHD